MERYLIAIDMDGTLLNDKKKISFFTKQYLKYLTKKGHIVVLASGRPPRSILSYYNELRLDTPLICYNGAYTYNTKDTSFIGRNLMFSKEESIEIYKQIKPLVKNVMFESLNNIYIDTYDKDLDSFFWYKTMNVFKGNIEVILTNDVYTFIGRYEGNKDKLEKTLLKAIEKYPDINLRFWTGAPYFELHYKKATKGQALKEVADFYNIDIDHIIAFGDAANDIDMFNLATHSVFMTNGIHSDEIKTKYTSIKDNNHNGIYHTLKAFFKGKLS